MDEFNTIRMYLIGGAIFFDNQRKRKWKEVIEAQKQSGLTIKKYCNDNPICISSFYKQKGFDS